MTQRRFRSVFTSALLLLLGACTDGTESLVEAPVEQGTEARRSTLPEKIRQEVRGLPALEMDLPPEPRPWDTSAVVLRDRIREAGGVALVAIKSPASSRVLGREGPRGVRSAVSASEIRQGLEDLQAAGVELGDYLSSIGAVWIHLPQELTDLGPLLLENPRVDYVEPHRTYPAAAASSPKRSTVLASPFTQTTPWGISTIRASQAWSTSTGSGAELLIIDTGHDQGHEDLPSVPANNCGPGSGQFTGCSDASGGGWHGTHILGIATAVNNSIGVVGVAPGISDSDVYVWGGLDEDTREVEDSLVAEGLDQGITWGVDVISMSLVQDTIVHLGTSNQVSAADSADIVLVAAAGNHNDLGVSQEFYPALYTKVIGVSGINDDKSFADPSNWSSCNVNSNHGIHVDVAAPFDAYSTIGSDSYTRGCGTSQATPHVAGVALLIRSAAPSLSAFNVRLRLQETAEDLGASGWDEEFGEGMVDAHAALGPHVSIDGPTEIPPNVTCIWSADVEEPGYGTLSYEWFKNSSSDGTGSTYSTSSSSGFEIKLVVEDGHGFSDDHTINVAIDSQAPPQC